ncbi:hypothetical protein F5Y18DRAFT_235468 [Xylariaceae sp. FL1019]|nr:hypothetical protein F5Y18DRAFT_235468 [Xylariaceae sp. FL1019]
MAPQYSHPHPPSLPPTVEEAYRRKCIQLKERSKEIEEENDAYRLRLHRLKRQIQKLRLERAFLLEQISKRTSTNVEDSEGSPSPPPTPQDKPLRTKRGHQSSKEHGGRSTNGAAKPPKRPSNAFEIYCNDRRPVLQEENKDKITAGEFMLEEELARGWKDLEEEVKDSFQKRYERELDQWRTARDTFKQGVKDASARSRGRASRGGGGRSRVEESIQDEDLDDDNDQDVEMAEADQDPGHAADQDTDPETEVDDNDG